MCTGIIHLQVRAHGGQMFKLVAIDIDGTLLNSQRNISNENKRVIMKAAEKGVRIIICSGRVFTGARYFARQLQLNDPIISCNGAEIREIDTSRLLFGSYINLEDCIEITDICRHENIYVHTYVGETMYTERLEFGSKLYALINRQLPRKDRIDIRVVKNLKRVFQLNKVPASKFVVVSEVSGHLSRVKKLIRKIKTVDITSSFSDNIEIVNRGVDKGSALKYLSEQLNINRNEIIAIGDNENDRTMFEFAGLSAVMGNAGEHLKDIAGYVTSDNDNEGVSEVFKKFVI
jgi:Cof subfamily protein (haloacid dehalogenase superfamily)